MKYAYTAVAFLWTAVVVVVLIDGGYRQLRVILGGTTACLALWSFVYRRWRIPPGIDADTELSGR